ncbi:MAG TPA: DUF6259 domain-containing protein [Acidobacteriaceae bacterium]|nr:DUF6259 domain-containing protein [Acidobacteriaceae bacterium]
MSRRIFNKLAGSAALGVFADSRSVAEAPIYPHGTILLEDKTLRCEFSQKTGALIGLQLKNTGWQIQRRPELGVSFRLHAPLPERRDNFILGHRQELSSLEQTSETQVRLTWKNLLSEHGGTLPITFDATVSLVDGSLTFTGDVVNNSDLTIETLDYPYLGDLSASKAAPRLQAMCQRYDNLETTEIHPHFANEKGYWGTDFPTKTFEAYNSLFCLIQGEKEGLYVEMQDPSIPYFLEYTFEMHPGVISNLAPFSSVGAVETGDVHLVPQTDSIDGLPVHLEFRTCHFVFIKRQTSKTLAPIRLRPYQGDWHAGIDVYKKWRDSWYQPARLPRWVTEVHSWYQLQLNSPEEEFRVRYTDLPKYADECVKYGVTAIHLIGWNKGGQDRGNPSQDTDPGLGTLQEFKQAIAAVEGKGIRVILFAKFPWADMTTAWYKTDLYKYAATDPYGTVYQYAGDSYHTPTQLAGINNRAFAVMDFCSPAYREVAVREFQKILDLRPSGWLYDEVCFHGQVKYSFASDHGYEPPGYLYGYDMVLARRLRDEADKVNPDFLFAGEGPQDWLTQYYPCSYYRGSATAVQQYVAPRLPMVVAVNGFDDREQINRILLQRSIICYEPFNFKGKLSDFGLTVAYGQKVDALRRRFAAWLWNVDFCDTVGASVRCSTGNQRDYSFSVLRAQNGNRTVVLVNERADQPIDVTVDIPQARRTVVVTPEEPEPVVSSGRVSIPPRSAAVVMEL